MGRPIRVVIVDDQPLIRQGFAMILAAHDDMEVVGEAADGAAAVTEITRAAPDVVLMDIRMPGVDGIEATRQAQIAAPHARILVVTTFGLDEYVTEALAAGASGFVLKDSTPEELLQAVRVVARGDALLSPAVTTRLIERMLPSLVASDEKGRHRQSDLDQLTDREVEVLLLLARGGSNVEIGKELHISEATVKTHISHLLTKLGVRDRVQAVIAAYELGLLTPAGPPGTAGGTAGPANSTS
jgi:DNA-binding NarL/FixJ family response regulator